MKFSCSITIDRPVEEVVALFQDSSKLGEYQDGFVKKELISGREGEVDAVAKMYYQQGKRHMVITETILVNNLPEEFLGSYHHEHMDNTMRCQFTTLSDGKTRYDSHIEYTAFRGFFPKLFATLFPSMFKKQVQKWLDNFKAYAEGE